MPDFDGEAFARDLDALRLSALREVGPEDLTHFRKVQRWGRLCSAAGWAGADPIFFIWQAGAFHFVLAAGYLVEYSRTQTISLLLIAKTTAFVFLIGGSLLVDTPWSVWFSGFADGAMALTAFLVHRAVKR